MVLFPALVVTLNGIFTVTMVRQFLRRRKSYQLAWTASLILGCAAAAFYLLFLGFGRLTVYFQIYYLCGGLLMAAYLGLGSIYLHAGKRVGNYAAGVLILASVVAAFCLFSAPVDASRLHAAASSLGPGTSAIGPGPWKALAAVLNSLGAVAVIAGAIYSAWRSIIRHAPARIFQANLLIAGGTLIAAIAGVVADQGTFAGSFWIVLAVGFIVLFAGFLLASHPPTSAPGSSGTVVSKRTLPATSES